MRDISFPMDIQNLQDLEMFLSDMEEDHSRRLRKKTGVMGEREEEQFYRNSFPLLLSLKETGVRRERGRRGTSRTQNEMTVIPRRKGEQADTQPDTSERR